MEHCGGPSTRSPGSTTGPLSPHLLVKPRVAPAIFGVGLLEAVASSPARPGPGCFGWQASALSVRDQTTRALAREMGVTSTDRPEDDCTGAETGCLQQRHPATPEIQPNCSMHC